MSHSGNVSFMKQFFFCLIVSLGGVFGKYEPLGETQSYRLPKPSITLERVGHCSVYDTRNKVPYYVYERLTKDSVTGVVKRRGFSFREDENIPMGYRSLLSDYRGSGYDRGHLCPAGDCVWSIEAMDNSFLLTNIGPQVPSLNRGIWSRLERHIRDFTNDYDSVEVFTGCLFLPKDCEDGKRRVIFEVIGEGDVAVPTHFYKVVFLRRGDRVENVAYILPNEKIVKSAVLEDFREILEKLERISGIVFSQINR